MRKYHFTMVYTDKHWFEVDAVNEDDARRQMEKLEIDDAVGSKNFDYEVTLESVDEAKCSWCGDVMENEEEIEKGWHDDCEIKNAAEVAS